MSLNVRAPCRNTSTAPGRAQATTATDFHVQKRKSTLVNPCLGILVEILLQNKASYTALEKPKGFDVLVQKEEVSLVCPHCGVRPSPQSGPNKPHLCNNLFLSLSYDRSHAATDAPHSSWTNRLTPFSATQYNALISHRSTQYENICHSRVDRYLLRRHPPARHNMHKQYTTTQCLRLFAADEVILGQSLRLPCGFAPVVPRTALVIRPPASHS